MFVRALRWETRLAECMASSSIAPLQKSKSVQVPMRGCPTHRPANESNSELCRWLHGSYMFLHPSVLSCFDAHCLISQCVQIELKWSEDQEDPRGKTCYCFLMYWWYLNILFFDIWWSSCGLISLGLDVCIAWPQRPGAVQVEAQAKVDTCLGRWGHRGISELAAVVDLFHWSSMEAY